MHLLVAEQLTGLTGITVGHVQAAGHHIGHHQRPQLALSEVVQHLGQGGKGSVGGQACRA